MLNGKLYDIEHVYTHITWQTIMKLSLQLNPSQCVDCGDQVYYVHVKVT